jgi:thymidine phosphorylase
MTDLKKQLATESIETFNTLVNSQFDNESARIQQQMDELDKQKEKEIEVANATITNKQERETAIARIEARAQAEKERLERRQRQVDLDRARFEKAANIAQIIGNTAVAIMNQLKVTPLPAGAPFIAAIGTIGALQLARAIAAPLPKFAEGTEDAPGGLAWVGDAYKKELVITPQGKVMQTPAVPTVMNVPKHSIVLPDARAVLEGGLAVNQFGKLVSNGGSDTSRIEQKLDTIAKAIKNKPVLNMNANESGLTAMWNYGANTISYIEDQTRF